MGFATRVKRYAGARRRPVMYVQVGPAGVRDSVDPSASDRTRLTAAENIFPLSSAFGGGWWGRPGITGAGAQLGAGALREGQRTYQFTKLDGTEYTIRFTAGAMYSLNWTTGVWSAIALGAGCALPTSGRIYCCTFADQLIVNPNDGVNKPWAWSGAAFTALTNAPIAYGAPVVHYAKLFFIKWAERNTFVWSQEQQPNVGYEATIGAVTYDNAWTLGQTDQEGLFRLVATNSALYYFRARSIGLILGEVDANFRSTGTLEGVSTTIGSTSPDAFVLYDDSVWFLDADAQPQRLLVGGGLQSPGPWEEARETTSRLPLTALKNATAIYWQEGDLVWFGVASPSASDPNKVLCYHARTGLYTGIFTGWDFTALDVVKNGSGVPTVVQLSRDGYAYRHGHLTESIWSDAFAAVTRAISHQASGMYHGFDTMVEKHFNRLDLALRQVTDLTDVRVKVTTPYGTTTEETIQVTGGSARWGSGLWGTDVWAASAIENHVEVGFDPVGRWGKVSVRHSGLNEQFGLIGWTLTGYPLGPIPETV